MSRVLPYKPCQVHHKITLQSNPVSPIPVLEASSDQNSLKEAINSQARSLIINWSSHIRVTQASHRCSKYWPSATSEIIEPEEARVIDAVIPLVRGHLVIAESDVNAEVVHKTADGWNE